MNYVPVAPVPLRSFFSVLLGERSYIWIMRLRLGPREVLLGTFYRTVGFAIVER